MHQCIHDDCDQIIEKRPQGRTPARCAPHTAEYRKAAAIAYQRRFRAGETGAAKSPCTQSGCTNRIKARRLCSTHYNQTFQASRHKKVPATCDGCGATCMKEQRSQRYGQTFCSDLCRDYTRFGPTSSTIPRHHIARWAGRTCEWTPPEIPTLLQFDCGWCGKTDTMRSTRPKSYCSNDCKQKAKRVRRRGAEHGSTGVYTWAEIVRLWLTFDKACAYCRVDTPLDDIQAEHVEPISRGGANNLTNLLPSCGPCNSDKRDLSLDAWAADRARRGLPSVATTWDASDPRYYHLTTRRTPVRAA